MCLQSPLVGQFLILSLMFMTLAHLKITGQLFCRGPSIYVVMMRFRSHIFGRDITELCVLLVAFYQVTLIFLCTIAEVVYFLYLIKVVSASLVLYIALFLCV